MRYVKNFYEPPLNFSSKSQVVEYNAELVLTFSAIYYSSEKFSAVAQLQMATPALYYLLYSIFLSLKCTGFKPINSTISWAILKFIPTFSALWASEPMVTYCPPSSLYRA